MPTCAWAFPLGQFADADPTPLTLQHRQVLLLPVRDVAATQSAVPTNEPVVRYGDASADERHLKPVLSRHGCRLPFASDNAANSLDAQSVRDDRDTDI